MHLRKPLARSDHGRLAHVARSPSARLALTVGSAALTLVFAVLVGRRLAAGSWPLAHGHPALLVAAGLLSLLGYGLKACGWRRLFAADERPQPLALAAANGGASVTGLALPGRFDDVVRIAILRNYRGCPAGVRTLCLSLFMLGLVDAAALAPIAAAASALTNGATSMRTGLALVAGIGVAASAVIVVLPRLARSRRLLRFRFGGWLSPRTTTLCAAAQAWVLVSACWLVRTTQLFLLLGALGIGFSFPLAALFLCAGAASAALPVGPGGAATQAGASAAVLIASGVGTSEAVGVAVSAQALGVLAGAAIFLFAAVGQTGLRFAPTRATA